MAYAGAPKNVALRLARTVYEIACPTLVHTLTYIHTIHDFILSQIYRVAQKLLNIFEKRKEKYFEFDKNNNYVQHSKVYQHHLKEKDRTF